MANLGKSVKGKNKKKKMAPPKEPAKPRRLEESDLAKRLAALERKRLREALDKEKKMSKWNLAKIQNTWRKIMRLAKVESLRKDIEIVSQNHERDVDRKDAIIQMLDRDVEEAEEQYQIALRQHLRNMDRLIDLQDERLLTLEEEFDRDLKELDDEFHTERTLIERQHAVDTHELQTIIETMATDETDKRIEAKTEHDQTREIIRNKNLEAVHLLQSALDNQIEELERAFESAHLTYLTNTDQRTQEFKDLTQADQTLSADIDVKIRKIDKLQTSLQLWRTKMASNSRECEDRNATLRTEKETISSHFQALKAKMNRHRDAQKRRLVMLTKAARETTAVLTDRSTLAEGILTAAERARKLETAREKVLVFGESDAVLEADGAGEEDRGPVAVPDKLKEEVGLAGLDGEEWTALDHFYKRYNRVLLDKLALEREQAALAMENEQLQSVLKQYLEGVSITEATLSGPNTLLIVNGESSITAPPVRAMAPIPVVEANHMVTTGRATGAPMPRAR